MTWHTTRPVLISIFTVCLILSVSTAIIAYGRGYRLNFNKPTSLTPTGIITATSDPVAAQVLVDSTLKTATNNSFNIDPGWYTVTIRKEAYIPWEKKLRVQGEVVTRADAYLFPTSPSLSPITTSGILSPTVSPDGNTIAFFKKTGLYTLELSDRPLGGRNRDPKLVADGVFPSGAEIVWSPDATEIVIVEGKNASFYDLTRSPAQALILSQTRLDALHKNWQGEVNQKNQQKLMAFKQGFIDVATSSARILSFSPDETKLLYEATASATLPLVIDPPLIGTNPTEETRTIKPGNLYVYDSREDKNYFIEDSKKLLSPMQWFPTSRHLLVTGNGKIDVMEYDRTNWVTIYSGPFEQDFVTPWPTGSRIVILTNLNPGAGSLPNLYTVNLR